MVISHAPVRIPRNGGNNVGEYGASDVALPAIPGGCAGWVSVEIIIATVMLQRNDESQSR